MELFFRQYIMQVGLDLVKSNLKIIGFEWIRRLGV